MKRAAVSKAKKKDEDKPRSIRMSDGHWAEIAAAAQRLGHPVSTYARDVLLRAARADSKKTR